MFFHVIFTKNNFTKEKSYVIEEPFLLLTVDLSMWFTSYWDAKLIFSFLEKLEFGSTTTLESRRTAEVIHLLDYPDGNEGGFTGKSLMKLKVILPHKVIHTCLRQVLFGTEKQMTQLLECIENYSEVLEDFEYWPVPWKIVTFSKFKLGTESQPDAAEEKFGLSKSRHKSSDN